MNTHDQPDLFRHYGGGCAESVAAYATIAPTARAMRMKILGMIAARGAFGATANEMEIALNFRRSTVSGRFSELKHLGLITKHGTRPTVTGCKAGVFVASRIPKP